MKVGGLANRTPLRITPPAVITPAIKAGGLVKRTPDMRLVGVTVPAIKLGGLRKVTPATTRLI